MQGVDLSPVGLFLGASLVGKAVMAVLFVASLWCWVLIIEGVVSVLRLGRAVRLLPVFHTTPKEIRRTIAGPPVRGPLPRPPQGSLADTKASLAGFHVSSNRLPALPSLDVQILDWLTDTRPL